MLILQKTTASGRIIFYKTKRKGMWLHKRISMKSTLRC